MRSAGFRKAILGFVTTLVVAGAVILYLIFFVNDRREARIERNFRILNRVTSNVELKSEKLASTAANFIEQEQTLGGSSGSGWRRAAGEPAPRLLNFFLRKKAPSNLPITVGKSGFQTSYQGVSYTYPFEAFLHSVLRSDAFDHYLLINEDHEVYYHPSDIHLLSLQMPDSISLTDETRYDKITLAGQQYHLFSSPFEVSGKKLVMLGLSSEERFNEATSSIPSLYIIIFSLLFIILLLSYPFIKFWMISANERLKRSDVVAAVAALFFGTSIAALLLFDLNTYMGYLKEEIPDGLEGTSQSIIGSFEDELDNILFQLEMAQVEYQNIKANGGNTDQVLSTEAADFYRHWLEASPFPNFLNIAWIDSSGQQQVKWSPGASNTRKVDVSGRSYFTDVMEHKFLYRRGQPFVIQSISSLNDTRSYASFSVPGHSGDYPVVTLTTRLATLHDPVLSLGYGFALINEDGQVLFHSDRQRNLQENFTEEVSNSEEFKALLNGRNHIRTEGNYHGSAQEMLITPLHDWPLFLVTYYDKSHLNSVNAEILSFSIISLLIYSVPLTLLILSLVYFRSSHSRLSFSNLRLQWLAPQPQYRLRYLLILILMLGLIGLLLLMNRIAEESDSPNLSRLSLALSLPFPAFTGSYMLMQYHFRNQKHRWRFYFLLALNLLLLLALSEFLQAQTWITGLFLLLSASLILLLSWLKNQRVFLQPTSGSFVSWYRLAAVALILTISLPFIHGSYSISHDTERLLYHRLAQLHLVKELQRRTLLQEGMRSINDAAFLHLSPPYDLRFTKEAIHHRPQSAHFFSRMYSAIRPKFSETTRLSNYLNESSGQQRIWHWESPDVMYFKPETAGNYLRVEYQLNRPNELLNIPLVLLLGFIGIPVIVYSLIGSLSARIFIHSTFSNATFIKIEDLISDTEEAKLRQLRVYFFGLPKLGKTAFLLQLTRDLKIPLQLFDFADLEEMEQLNVEPKTQLVFIDHFEYGEGIELLELRKLSILEELLSEHQVGIVLIASSMPPFSIADLKPSHQNAILNQQWLKLLGNFSKTYYQSSRKIGDSVARGLAEFEDLNLIRLLNYECRAFPFLKDVEQGLRSGIIEGSGEQPPGYDELILKVQSIAAFYYHELWSNCSVEEKYLLYDLAQDGLVNIRNSRVISSLISKGLVLQDGLLRIVNLSFRNFILTHADLSEIETMEQEVNLKSSWRKVRLPLILLLVVMAAVLFYLQRDLLDEVTGMITAVGGVLLMLMRFSGSLKSSPKNPEGS